MLCRVTCGKPASRSIIFLLYLFITVEKWSAIKSFHCTQRKWWHITIFHDVFKPVLTQNDTNFETRQLQHGKYRNSNGAERADVRPLLSTFPYVMHFSGLDIDVKQCYTMSNPDAVTHWVKFLFAPGLRLWWLPANGKLNGNLLWHKLWPSPSWELLFRKAREEDFWPPVAFGGNAHAESTKSRPSHKACQQMVVWFAQTTSPGRKTGRMQNPL